MFSAVNRSCKAEDTHEGVWPCLLTPPTLYQIGVVTSTVSFPVSSLASYYTPVTIKALDPSPCISPRNSNKTPALLDPSGEKAVADVTVLFACLFNSRVC